MNDIVCFRSKPPCLVTRSILPLQYCAVQFVQKDHLFQRPKTKQIKMTVTLGGSPSSWWKGLVAIFLKDSSLPATSSGPVVAGQVWSAHDAARAYTRGDLNSREAGQAVRVAFRNQSNLPLIVCWVGEDGSCHHYYSLQPSKLTLANENAPVTVLDHVENTNVGHSFCIAYAGEDDEKVRNNEKLEAVHVIGGYRPTRHGKEDDEEYVHLVTISQQPAKKEVFCCDFRGANRLRHEYKAVGNNLDDDSLCWVVQAHESCVDITQINTCDKVYEKTTLGGWPVCVEPDWNEGDEELKKLLARDLEYATKCLPKHAREYLIQNTPLFINKSLKYGPEACPINAQGLCFHGEKQWLEEHFMSTEKHQGVELYCAKGYYDDCKMWGCGGVFVHEFSHAYHYKCVDKGFDNPEILECFEKAMKDRLYDWVRVHGTQGPMNKAYACNNAMEYFAELSAAFLGQREMNASEEYNKWYPFNRRHIKEHDPRAYEMLKKIWKVDD
jgi:hypothetical protein